MKRSGEELAQKRPVKKSRNEKNSGKSRMSLARAREVLQELKRCIIPQRFREKLAALLRQEPAREKLAALLGREPALFAVAPSKITEDQFSKRYGMIRLIPDTMPPYDRFSRKQFPVREAALRAAGACVFKDVYTSARHLGFPRLETAASSIFSRLLCSFALFMRHKPEKTEDEPELEDVNLHLDLDEDVSSEGSESEDAIFMDLEFPEDDDEDDDYDYVSLSDDSDALVSSSDATREQTADPFQPRCHSDLFMFVTLASGVRVLKLGIDIKTSNVKHRDLLQVFMYVDGHTKRTAVLGKEARPPVYLHAMDTHKWRYAISEIDGYVQVKGHELVEASLHSFPDSLARPLSDEFTSPFTKDEVRNMFRTWRASLQAENVALPDGLYPAGRLFYSTKAWGMPTFESGFGAMPLGALKLYSGWLHILIGKGVKRWTPKKVWERYFTHEFAHLMVGMRRVRAPWIKWMRGVFRSRNDTDIQSL